MTLVQAQAFLQAKVGEEIHLSDWLTVTQEMITAFGKATGDMQWIHVDPERAAAESPYKQTIAHGYFTLSLYPQLRGLVDERTPVAPGVERIINYGLNKLRFPNAVTAGSRVRSRCRLLAVEPVKDSLQIIEEYTVEVEGQDRPACVAEAVMRLYF
jgi:acyl dehydratase